MDSRHILLFVWITGLFCLAEGAPAQGNAPDTAGMAATAPKADSSLPAAADTALALEPVGDGEISYPALMLKLGLGLGLVVLLAWGTVFLLRKSAFGKQLGGLGQAIRVVERLYLGPKKAIYLVQIGGHTLALGVTEASISPLAQWSSGELDLPPRPSPPDSFATQLRSLLGQKQPGGSAQEG